MKLGVSVQNRSIGILLGLVWGDVLGCPVEYWDKTLIESVYGNYSSLPKEYPLERIPREKSLWSRLRPIGLYSDDTQQAIALIHACLRAEGWSADRWARSLVEGSKRNAWRGTGRNFRAAVAKMSKGLPPLECGIPTAGLGGAMRIAPLSAIYWNDLPTLERVVFESTCTTHTDIRGISMAFVVACCCAQLIAGTPTDCIRNDLPKWIREFEQRFGNSRYVVVQEPSHKHAVSATMEYFLSQSWADVSSFRNAISNSAADHSVSLPEATSAANHPFVLLGGVHAVCSALWPSTNPSELLNGAIREGGDTDTVGAILGAILGARFGSAWIPEGVFINEDSLHAYAKGLADRSLPESFDNFLSHEAELSVMERRFSKNLVTLLSQGGSQGPG
jgi:ADP-ribosyl-[dinitrogen reductase] hydrolase